MSTDFKTEVIFAGISTHVITFEVGAVLPHSETQAPAYCFDKKSETIHLEGKNDSIIVLGK